MIESNLYEGNQNLPHDLHDLHRYSESEIRLRAFSMLQDTKVVSQIR